jgi:acyl carrier protein
MNAILSPDADLTAEIARIFADVWTAEQPDQPVPELAEETVLLETGLDSLGFAIFVSTLEEELGYDPFTLAEDAYYPRTFGEFVTFYAKYRPAA